MAYQMEQVPITWSEDAGNFCYLKPF